MMEESEVIRILSLLPKSLDENKSDIVSLHGTKGKPGYELMHPKGTVSSQIGSNIFSKYGQQNVDKLHGDAMKFYMAGQSVESAVDSAAKNAKVHNVPVYAKGKPAGFFPPGTDLYVGKNYANNPKDSPVVYAHVKNGQQEKWYTVTAAGQLEVGPTTLPSLNKAVEANTLQAIPYAYGEFEPHTPEAKKLGVPDSLDPNQPGLDTPDPSAHTAQTPSAPSVSNVPDPVAHIAPDISSDEATGTGNNGPDFPVWAKGEKLGSVPAGTQLYAVEGAGGGEPKNVPIVYAHMPDGSFKMFSQKNPEGKELSPHTSSLLSEYIAAGKYPEIEQNVPHPNQPDQSGVNTPDVGTDPNSPNVPGANPGTSVTPGDTNAPGSVPNGPSGPTVDTSTKLPSGQDHGQPTTQDVKDTSLKGPDGNPILPPPSKAPSEGASGPDMDGFTGLKPGVYESPNGYTFELIGDGNVVSGGANVSKTLRVGVKHKIQDGSYKLKSGGYGVGPNAGTQQAPLSAKDQLEKADMIKKAKSGTSTLDDETTPLSTKKFEISPDPGTSGDTHIEGGDGVKLWGKYGAAGVLLRHKDENGVETYLLAQRGSSSNNGKWQLPGGALSSKENDYQAAARELTEELSPPEGYLNSIKPVGEVLYQHSSGWHYNNLVADVPEQFTPTPDGGETSDAKWFTKEEIDSLPLHPALKNNLDAIFNTYNNPTIKNENDEDAKDFSDPTPDAPDVGDNVPGQEAGGPSGTPNAPDVNTPAPDVNAPPESPEEPTPAATTKPMYVKGKQVGDIPSDSDVYTHKMFASDPKNSPVSYVKHADGTTDIYYGDTGAKNSATPLSQKYINQDIDSGIYVKAQSFDGANFGNDVTPSNDHPFDAADTKINVGGVNVTSAELADGIAKLKNGPSWQVKVHLKGHPLYNMDYLSIAKDQQDKSGKTLPTKDAVIKGLEEKLGKVASTDAEQAITKSPDVLQQLMDAIPNSAPPEKVDVGGVHVNKAQLEHAINAVTNGESSYPKVNLKKANSPLANLDMAAVMKAENKKVTESTQDVLLKHLNKKLGQFHTDELSGKELADPELPKEPLVTNPDVHVPSSMESALDTLKSKLNDYETAQKPSNKEVTNEISAPSGAAASENIINAAGLKVAAGVYKKPGGYFAQIEAKPDGTFYYTGSKNKTGTVQITGKKFKSLHESGFQNYIGAPQEDTSVPKIEVKEMHEATPANTGGMPPGDYFTHNGMLNYTIFPDGTGIAKDINTGTETVLDHSKVEAITKNGYVHDKYGTTVIPPGIEPDPYIFYHLFGSQGLSKAQLEQIKEEISQPDGGVLLHLKKYEAKSHAILKMLTDTNNTGGVKSAVISTIDNLLHAAETKQTHTPATGIIHNADAPNVNPSIFTFDAKTGYAISPSTPMESNLSEMSVNQMKDQIKDISKEFGDGNAIGKFANSFTPQQAHSWLKSFYNGDMKGVYNVDSHTMADFESGQHPGAPGNEATHKITWAPAVPGELPAGTPIQSKSGGKWPSSSHEWDNFQTHEYLVKANAQNTDYMATSTKKLWVNAHANGNKLVVDSLSLKAKSFADDPETAPFASKASFKGKSAAPYDPNLPGTPDAGWKKYDKNSSAQAIWTATDIDKYIEDYSLPNTSNLTYSEKGALIDQHKANIPEKVTGPGTNPITLQGTHITDVPATHDIYHSKNGMFAFSKSPEGQWTFYDDDKNKNGENMEPAFVPAIEGDVAKGKLLLVTKGDPNAAPPTPANKDPFAGQPVSTEPVYTITSQSGLTLGNNQQTTGVDDQFGNKYIFKPYSDSEMFRAEVEHGANNISRMFGFKTSESKIVTIDGKSGQLQTRHDALHDFTGIDSTDISKMGQNALNDLAKEHLLDWSLDNPDSRSLNVLHLKDGSVVGIDKGMFGKHAHTGEWEGLYPDSRAHLYEPLVYTRLYDGIKQGLYSKDQIDSIYKSVIQKAREMEKVKDSDLRSQLEAAYKNAPGDVESKIKNFLKRKKNLVNDMDTLWGRVYDNTSYQKPEVPTYTVNSQGHVLHPGFTADHVADAKLTKSYGTTAFFGGSDVEDIHALTWKEKRSSDGKFNVRGELKVHGKDKINEIENYLAANCITKDPYSIPAKVAPHPKEEGWHKTILVAAGNVAYHSDDGQYNQSKLDDMEKAKGELNDLLKNTSEFTGTSPADIHKNDAQKEMAKQYLNYIKTIEDAKTAGSKPSKADVVRFDYKPFSEPALNSPVPDKPEVKIEKMQATRAASTKHNGSTVELENDGHLAVGSHSLDPDEGQDGHMYLVTLPTGETIEFRGNKTGSPIAVRGQLRYTIPNEDETDISLGRIQDQLRTMGLDLKPADENDFELYYWRHLAAIMKNRSDSSENGYYYSDPKYKTFWTKVDKGIENKGGPEEISMWRNAFATITNKEQVDKFVAEGGHLPQFNHQDMRNAKQATGRPWWKRFDVEDKDIENQEFPVMQSSQDYGLSLVKSGGVWSTEGRVRTFGTWFKSGVAMSSSEDQTKGSSTFIFTRLNIEDDPGTVKVMLAPHVLAKTHNYGFDEDNYGNLNNKSSGSYFDIGKATSHSGSGNETMIKDNASLLDDIELVFISDQEKHEKALDFLRSQGIHEIRGIPIEDRIVNVHTQYDYTKKPDTEGIRKAVKKVREWYKKNKA